MDWSAWFADRKGEEYDVKRKNEKGAGFWYGVFYGDDLCD